eukprot:SM000122S25809  [mRNA]  locus=s122:328966:329980:- [translate_table: standard]
MWLRRRRTRVQHRLILLATQWEHGESGICTTRGYAYSPDGHAGSLPVIFSTLNVSLSAACSGSCVASEGWSSFGGIRVRACRVPSGIRASV